MPAAGQALIWRLDPEGTCGVGDHTRGLARHLGWRILDASLDDRLEPGRQLIQYVPMAWVRERGWVGAVAALLDAESDRQRTLFIHEVDRGMRPTPRALARAFADRAGLHAVVEHCARIVVTTEARAKLVRELLAAWQLPGCVAVVGVPSTVHAEDPALEARAAPPAEPALVTFTSGNEPAVTCQRVAASIAATLRQVPGLRVHVLGWRRTHNDPLRAALARERCADDVNVTDALPPEQIARLLDGATVALATPDAGVAGRRTTVAASLAAGTPLVGLDGPDTDPIYRECEGIALPCTVDCFDPRAVADAVVRACALSRESWRARSLAARGLYLGHNSWEAQRRVLDQ